MMMPPCCAGCQQLLNSGRWCKENKLKKCVPKLLACRKGNGEEIFIQIGSIFQELSQHLFHTWALNSRLAIPPSRTFGEILDNWQMERCVSLRTVTVTALFIVPRRV